MVCQRYNVETQRRDVTEACVFEFVQCRDVGVQRRDVIEKVNFNLFFFTKLSKSEKTR